MLRIEFTERIFVDEPTEEDIESAKNLKLPMPKGKVQYRRIYVLYRDIFAPKEMPDKKSHCLIEFQDGTTIVVKGSYDDICLQIDDYAQKMLDRNTDFKE